jgi:hypothetical protein
MPHFIEHILTEEGIFTFTFNRVYGSDGFRYYIKARQGQRLHTFFMQNKEGEWALGNLNKLPGWILMLESKLRDVIHENSEVE